MTFLFKTLKKRLTFCYGYFKISIANITKGTFFYEDYFTHCNKNTIGKKNKEIWEKLSYSYTKNHPTPPNIDFINSIIKAFPDPKTSILEYGSSSGMNLNYLFKKAYHDVVGIDISNIAISEGRKRYPSIPLFAGNLSDSNFKIHGSIKKKFNLIFTRAVLQHIEQDELHIILNKFHTLLTTKGSLFISECNKSNKPFGRIKGHRVYNTFNHNWPQILRHNHFKIINTHPFIQCKKV